MRKQRQKKMTRKHSIILLLLAVVVLLCYAAVWLEGDIWALVWKAYHRHDKDKFVPASAYHQP